jgi:biotin transport system substrate-specific component
MSVVQLIQKSTAKIKVLKAVVGFILLFACAQISIPLQPVPITLHTLAVLLIGLTYTPREAFITLSTYLGLGAIGLPVFASYQSGIIYLFGKTGGYLFGFLVAAVVMSLIQQSIKQRRWLQVLLVCTAGQSIIYTMGVAWLATFIGLRSAFAFGVLPFILPGMIKAVLLTVALQSVYYFDNQKKKA